MHFATYSLLRCVNGSNYLINLLYGTLDMVDEEIAEKLTSGDNLYELDTEVLSELKERGHVCCADEQPAHLKLLFKEYVRGRDVPTRLYVPFSLDCNLACTYCFQRDGRKVRYSNLKSRLEKIKSSIKELLEERTRTGKKYKVVLYGGEPLLIRNASAVQEMLSFCNEMKVGVDIITNGTTIYKYIGLLKQYNKTIDSVIVTVDGSKEFHDRSRVREDGAGTYDAICAGLKEAECYGIPCSIRVNLTDEIVDALETGDIRLSSKNMQFHRVIFKDYSKNVPMSALLGLILDGKIDANSMAVNQVGYFYHLMEDDRLPYPLFYDCPEDSVLLFSTDGKNVFSCNESETESLKVGEYDPVFFHKEFSCEHALEIDGQCCACEVYPICGGGCRARYRDFSDRGKCPYYSDIVSMIDEYIRRRC